MSKLKVVVAQPGEAARVTEIDSGLESMQAVVGGSIECVPIADDLDLWCNEEGLMLDLPFNRMIGRHNIVGPLFVASSNEEGDTIGLTDAQAQRAMLILNTAPRYPVVH